MADDQQAQPVAESAETQQEPMPSSEQQTADANTAPEAGQQAESTGQAEERSLPDDAKDRTKREFDKLKNDLATERKKRLELEKFYNQQPQASQQTNSGEMDYFDPDTGEVRVDRLHQRLTQAEQRAMLAEQQAQQVLRSEQVKQEQEAYASHPELDPGSDTFDEFFFDAVSGTLANAYAKGQSPSLKEVADRLKGLTGNQVSKVVEEAEKRGANQALERLSPKEEASLEATGRSDARMQASGTLEDLQLRTRSGDTAAIMERLKSIPPVGS